MAKRISFCIIILIVAAICFALTKEPQTVSYTFTDIQNPNREIVMEIMYFDEFQAKTDPYMASDEYSEGTPDWGITLYLENTEDSSCSDSISFYYCISIASRMPELWQDENRKTIKVGEREVVVVEGKEQVCGECKLYSHYSICFSMSKANYQKYKSHILQTISSAQVWIQYPNGNRIAYYE